METIRELAARRIEKRRKELGLSQAKAAALAGVPMRSYRRVEDPKHTLALDVLEAVARALGLEPWEIIKPSAPDPIPSDIRRALADFDDEDFEFLRGMLNLRRKKRG